MCGWLFVTFWLYVWYSRYKVILYRYFWMRPSQSSVTRFSFPPTPNTEREWNVGMRCNCKYNDSNNTLTLEELNWKRVTTAIIRRNICRRANKLHAATIQSNAICSLYSPTPLAFQMRISCYGESTVLCSRNQFSLLILFKMFVFGSNWIDCLVCVKERSNWVRIRYLSCFRLIVKQLNPVCCHCTFPFLSFL